MGEQHRGWIAMAGGNNRTIAVGATLSVGFVLLYMRMSNQSSLSEAQLDVAHRRLAALERNFESMRGTLKSAGASSTNLGDVGGTSAPATERGFFPVAGFSTPSALREDDQFNARLPARSNGEELSVSERLRYLELKTNGFMNWGNHYDMDSHSEPQLCRKSSNLAEFNPACGGKADGPCSGLHHHSIKQRPSSRASYTTLESGSSQSSG